MPDMQRHLCPEVVQSKVHGWAGDPTSGAICLPWLAAICLPALSGSCLLACP